MAQDIFFHKHMRRSAAKDGNLPVTDERCTQYAVRKGTFPAFAHSSTGEHDFSCMAQNHSEHGLSLRFEEVICSHGSARTLHPDTTLDVNDTRANVSDCNNPSAQSRLRRMFGFFADGAFPCRL